MSFRLSATLSGHEDDVKCLIAPSDDIIVSGSRDSTIRIWYRSSPESAAFNSSTINHKSSKFVNSLAYFDDGVEQLIVSGGNDNLINMTTLGSTIDVNEPQYCFVGHTANVCALDSRDSQVLSGSWDATAKVWSKTGDVLYDLKAHVGSVWSVKFLPERDAFLTCGADKTIKVWNKSKVVDSFVAHEDVVRDLLVLPNGDFVSCSNDGTIKIWDGHSHKLKQRLIGHDSFVYSLCLLPNGDIVSSGEDRSVRVWRDGKCIQVIAIPAVSVWKVISLPNGDIVVGSSDSQVRIFTRDPKRAAAKDEIEKFQNSIENSSISENLFGKINKEDLPGDEALSIPGLAEGQTKMIKNDLGTVEIYQWISKKWSKIGEINDSSSSDRKQIYQGKPYDYVFDVDIEDGKPPLKLPFNVADNPYEAADNFLAQNNLPYSYLQEIVNFILTNARGVTLDEAKGSDVPAPAPTSRGNGILPQQEYLAFNKQDVAKMVAGFRKLNAEQNVDYQHDPSDLEALISREDFDGLSQLASQIIQTWQNGAKLVGFDILRSVISRIRPFENLFPLIQQGLADENPKIEMMALRILANVFSAKWGEQTFMDTGVFDVIFTPKLMKDLREEGEKKGKKLLSITVATVILNYAVLINKFQSIGLYEKAIEVCDEYVPVLLDNEESSYRVLVGIGTLNCVKKRDGLKELAESITGVYSTERFRKVMNEVE
ncbi:DEKNAAC104315 [Brettanomyces naardenensis]|uniref:DEKNAAC104315 n=1 Tax=Brettanomyces naardenensis TaxID=13370 RepID=A0A448YQN6_BRENA|nr:DEKNAAC104315 [Brettanomyces naardenensis]